MGQTGNATGVHLHLEYATTQAWQCSTFLNPCTKLGIPNIRYEIINYDGSIEPPEPPKDKKRHKFPWAIYLNKFRGNF